jgi:hypothetical protein
MPAREERSIVSPPPAGFIAALLFRRERFFIHWGVAKQGQPDRLSPAPKNNGCEMASTKLI